MKIEKKYLRSFMPMLTLDNKENLSYETQRHVPFPERRTRMDRPSRRGITKQYFLTVNGQQTHVCQTFFLNTLSISEQTSWTALSKMTQAGTIETAKRSGQSEKVTARTHIKRFPRVESHFFRTTTTKECLCLDLTVQKMYVMFCKERDQDIFKPPSFRFYKNTFK